MEIATIYAIISGGVVLCLIVLYFRGYLKQLLRKISLQGARYLVYPQLVRRHRYIGPWSPGNLGLHLLYFTIIAICVGFRASSFQKAGLRAANLSLIHMIPHVIGSDLSFLADILWLPLGIFQLLHRSTALISLLLLLFHVLVTIALRMPFQLSVSKNLWGLTVSSRAP
jgi:hypothetical protein